MSLAWTSYPNAQHYVVKLYDTSFVLLRETTVTGCACTVSGLSPATTYYVEVQAYADGTYHGAESMVSVTTTGSAGQETTYRALLIGEVHFPGDTCNRNGGDVTLMANMLSGVKGGTGGAYSTVATYTDRSAAQIKSLISSTFAAADENDVSLFFIATHGDSSSTGLYAGSLSTVDTSGNTGYILLRDLATWLGNVPGKVIVLLESCGAGAAVYSSSEQQNSAALNKAAEEWSSAFVSSAVQAFASADRGIAAGTYWDYDETGAITNTGEFRTNHFYVLAAARYQENSYGWEGGNPHNAFTGWLAEGVGVSGNMPADRLSTSNKDGAVNLTELFNYIKQFDGQVYDSDSGAYIQHVQRYPVGSTYILFR